MEPDALSYSIRGAAQDAGHEGAVTTAVRAISPIVYEVCIGSGAATESWIGSIYAAIDHVRMNSGPGKSIVVRSVRPLPLINSIQPPVAHDLACIGRNDTVLFHVRHAR